MRQMVLEIQESMIDWPKQFPGIDFYDIQKQIILEKKKRTGIFLGTGVGKTLPTLVLAEGKTLVICPKQQMIDKTWEKENKKFNLGKDLTVINYDMFWRTREQYGPYDTVILDEGHRGLGVEPKTRQRNKVQIPKTSKTFEAILVYIREHQPDRFYIATATPMSKPMNVWAMAKLFHVDWNYFSFRETFYIPTMMGRRQEWIAKTDDATQKRLAGLVKRFGYTGALSDFMDVPEQKHLMPTDGSLAYIELSDEQKQALKQLNEDEADPMVRRSRMRTIENGILYSKKIEKMSEWEDRMINDTKFFRNYKTDFILEKAQEFSKMFIFAAYTAQIIEISRVLKEEGYNVVTVTSKTKNRDTVFVEADAMDKVIVVCQASICEGYRVPSAPCMIFMSKSNQFLHYDQGKGRILDGQHLKKNLYIHLVVKGGADESCHGTIMSGANFQEKLKPI